MGIPDSFDPTMFLSQTDTDHAGPYAAPSKAPGDSGVPSVVQYKGSGTDEIRSAANTKHNTEVPKGSSAREVFPSGVAKFDPINLSAGPRDESLASDGKSSGGVGG